MQDGLEENFIIIFKVNQFLNFILTELKQPLFRKITFETNYQNFREMN